jgi:hypothetical protein
MNLIRGVAVTPSLVITAYHCLSVKNAMVLVDGTAYPFSTLEIDAAIDVALLKIPSVVVPLRVVHAELGVRLSTAECPVLDQLRLTGFCSGNESSGQFTVDQKIANYVGYSGSPVCTDDGSQRSKICKIRSGV